MGPRETPTPYLAQLVLFLHLAQLIQVAEPRRHVQPPEQALLGVGLRRRQLGPSDGELHARPLIGELLDGWKEAGGERDLRAWASEASDSVPRKSELPLPREEGRALFPHPNS